MYWYRQFEPFENNMLLLDDWLTFMDKKCNCEIREGTKMRLVLQEAAKFSRYEGIFLARQVGPRSVEEILEGESFIFELPNCTLPLSHRVIGKINADCIETLVIGSIFIDGCENQVIPIQPHLCYRLDNRVNRLILAQPININHFCTLFSYPSRCLTGIWLTGGEFTPAHTIRVRMIAPNLEILKVVTNGEKNWINLWWFDWRMNRRLRVLQLHGQLYMCSNDILTNISDRLEVLELDTCLSVINFDFIKTMKQLRTIQIRNAPWLTSFQIQKAILHSVEVLIELDLSDTEVLCDELLDFLVRHEIALRVFRANLDGCRPTRSGFSDLGICSYVSCSWNDRLKRFELRGHGNISALILAVQWTCWQTLELLDLRNTGCRGTKGLHRFEHYKNRFLKAKNLKPIQLKIHLTTASVILHQSNPKLIKGKQLTQKVRPKPKPFKCEVLVSVKPTFHEEEEEDNQCRPLTKLRRVRSVHSTRQGRKAPEMGNRRRVWSEDNLSMIGNRPGSFSAFMK
jgi:hypothetical protein